MPSLVEIDPVVLEKKTKMWKVYNNDNHRQRTIFTWAFSSGELKSNVPYTFNKRYAPNKFPFKFSIKLLRLSTPSKRWTDALGRFLGAHIAEKR